MLGSRSVRGATFLVTPEDLQEFLSAVRTEIRAAGTRPALVTRSEQLRYFVRYLIREEWPEVPVLADSELVAPVTYEKLPVISLE
jgi:flagellar biosynthesis component FlhA